jgi:hypothetical protein
MAGSNTRSSGHSTQEPGDSRRPAETGPAANDAGKTTAASAEGNAAPLILSDHVAPPSFGADREEAVSMHQTARIMALVASMRQVDDISAYSLFGKNEGETDEHRHVVSAYRENSE